MKDNLARTLGIKSTIFAAVVALGAQATVLQSQAQIITLTDQNSAAQINVNSSAGMFNWNVDGVNELAKQWFWYRVGNSNPEQSIDTLSTATTTTPNSRTLLTSYFNTTLNYGVSINYTLTGFSAGSGKSHMDEIITITNGTSSALDFHFFQFSDFNLSGPGGDYVTLSRSLGGLFKGALQTNATASLNEQVNGVVTPFANNGMATNSAAIANLLGNGTADNLTGTTNFGFGDAAWALQWDLTVPAFGSLGISKIKDLQVPEPGTAALLGVGAMAYAWQRRRNNKDLV